MRVHLSHRLDDLMESSLPWFLFAQPHKGNLDLWHEHFRTKDIPHAVTVQQMPKRKKYQLWIRYQYDPNIWEIGDGKDRGNPRKPDVPPACLMEG